MIFVKLQFWNWICKQDWRRLYRDVVAGAFLDRAVAFVVAECGGDMAVAKEVLNFHGFNAGAE